MAWLRIDDGFNEHPKIAQLTDREFRAWMSVLCWCAAHRTRGNITIVEQDAKRKRDRKRTQIGRKVTPQMLQKWDTLRLTDRTEEGTLVVHDFGQYNPADPTAASRMRRYRDRNSDRNTGRNSDRNTSVTSRVGTRARPVPNPNALIQEGQLDITAADKTYVELPAALNELGWNPNQITAGLDNPERATAAINRARTEATTNPGGYAWQLFTSPDTDLEPEPAYVAARAWINEHGYPTGTRWKRSRSGTNGTYIRDPLGQDTPTYPVDWGKPSFQEIAEELALRHQPTTAQ